MGIKLKGPGKFAMVAVILGGIYAAKTYWWDLRPQEAKAAANVGKVVLPDAPEASLSGNAVMAPLPESKVSVNGGTRITWKIMAWNGQFAMMYANGGPNTTKGSLFDKAKVEVEIVRENDCFKSIADLGKFAQEYKSNPNTPGLFISLMGDGVPALMSKLHTELEKSLGPEYVPVAFYAQGKSYGEDQLMGPDEWKRNPKAAIGKTVATVLYDGDWNIVVKWAGDNGIPVNRSEKTYDPNAINFIAAADYIDAANKYITGYTEKRKLVVDGKIVPKDTLVGVDAVSTWTPADVNIAEQKGGLVTVVSTRQYSAQMPNITLTIKRWANDHRTDIENMITALGQAGDQVRSFSEAKKFAGAVSAAVYQEKDAKYWTDLYSGIKKKDAQGLDVSLGGSMAFNLADAANMFGLGEDKLDRYKRVYNTFGDIVVKFNPEQFPTYIPYEKMVDKSFLASVIANNSEAMEGKALAVNYASEISNTVSSRSYQILFETGKSNIVHISYPVLDEILASAVVAEDLKVGVYGHTDNVGNDDANMILSENRAMAVKSYLTKKGLSSERIEVRGFGSTVPVASNETPDGRAKNRRVQIVLGE